MNGYAVLFVWLIVCIIVFFTIFLVRARLFFHFFRLKKQARRTLPIFSRQYSRTAPFAYPSAEIPAFFSSPHRAHLRSPLLFVTARIFYERTLFLPPAYIRPYLRCAFRIRRKQEKPTWGAESLRTVPVFPCVLYFSLAKLLYLL